MFLEKLTLSAVRLANSDGIRLKMALEISKKPAKGGAKAGSSKKAPCPVAHPQYSKYWITPPPPRVRTVYCHTLHFAPR